MSEVTLPALGESVTEGTVTRWLKNVGDTVAVDEPLVEVSTDKVDTEIPSPFAGTLQQIMVQEDETVAVGAVLAVIGEGAAPAAAAAEPAAPVAEAPAAPVAAAPVVAAPAAPVAEAPVAAPPAPAPVAEAPVAAPPAPAPVAAAPVVEAPAAPAAPAPVAVAPAAPTPAAAAPVAPGAVPNNDSSYVTPIVRKLAAEKGIDLASVKGTGVGGRIRKEDLTATQGSSQASYIPEPASPLRGTTVPMSRLRKVLAERAVASMQQSAQLTSVVEVDVTKVANLRTKIQAEFTQKAGTKLSFMPFFTLAAAEALAANPVINSTVEDTNIVYHGQDNLSFAVETERGLLTPVIKNASSLTIAQLAQSIADMAERTRNNQLTPDELSGGTFTLTNTGSRGALFDTPVVFLPQSAILGTGIVTKRAAVVKDQDGNDAIAIRSMVYLALSYDHRIIDGADASRYLMAVKSRLEDGQFESVLGI
ncbi:2-oxo acid dehydrogenase subunit E2 [Aquiluna sp.]|nr:2-oxo acid dehydrogenase subunit E2 [Aquiluna sp.]